MNTRELREKNPEELRKLLLDLRREQFNLRMQSGSEQTIRPHQWGQARREIARIKTVLTELGQSH
ncbi:MAG: 50S ribosomal protein L29 [Gammaproteobacteria bacterium]